MNQRCCPEEFYIQERSNIWYPVQKDYAVKIIVQVGESRHNRRLSSEFELIPTMVTLE